MRRDAGEVSTYSTGDISRPYDKPAATPTIVIKRAASQRGMLQLCHSRFGVSRVMIEALNPGRGPAAP